MSIRHLSKQPTVYSNQIKSAFIFKNTQIKLIRKHSATIGMSDDYFKVNWTDFDCRCQLFRMATAKSVRRSSFSVRQPEAEHHGDRLGRQRGETQTTLEFRVAHFKFFSCVLTHVCHSQRQRLRIWCFIFIFFIFYITISKIVLFRYYISSESLK